MGILRDWSGGSLAEMAAVEGSASAAQGADSTTVCFNILIKGFGYEQNLQRVDDVVNMMRNEGVLPTQSTYNTLVNAYVNLNRVDKAWKVVQEALNDRKR